MLQRSNSRLAPRGRQRLVELVRAGESVSAVAREAGVSRQTAHKWIARAEAGELLSDRPSRPLSLLYCFT
ncbi:helix-turn-helix domain-containing protein [Parafannyhessea umbonata]|uniref:helix-turn-helix domain-containing protein n=1 Tax=Parafannyhessea umbonata TaxID=604330 RepID=UPI003AB31F43